jgi:outer membrane protein insertion porin family
MKGCIFAFFERAHLKGIRTVGLCLSLLLITSVAAAFAQEGVIKEIVIFGNERVDKEVILKEIGSKVGSPFSQERVRDDIKAIYSLGYFQDVQADESEAGGGIILTFAVIEKPFVANIVISGNVKLSQADIEGVIEVKKDAVLEMEKVRSSVKEIKKLYTSKRYFGSEVDYRVELEKGNTAVVYFDIVEGVKGYLTKITFVGNHAFSARKLRRIMQTKEKSLFWFLTKSGRLETDTLEVDMNRIQGLYFDHGYVTVKVSEPEITLSKDKKSIQVTIRIEEGDQYRLGGLDIQGDILTTKEALLKGLKSKVHKVYSASVTHKDLLWLTDQYADKGYAYADVSPLTMLDREQKLVYLTFKIEKGVKVHINRIEIAGNTKTRDKVIRRELKIAEGDLYNAALIRKSRERVTRTGYFKEVDFAPSPTEKKELIDLDIRLEEAEMGKIEFGAGYGNVTGVVGQIGLSHGNLFGLGYKAHISAELGQNVRNFSVGFLDPRFLDSFISIGFDAYNQSYNYDYYSTKATGGDIKFGMELTDTIRADLAYLYEQVTIYDVDTTVYEPGDYIYDQQGTSTTSKIILTFTRDTIDNPYNPTAGSKIWVSGAIAGPGGENYFYSVSGGVSWFHPLVGDLVLHLIGNAGIIRGYNNTSVPLTERFYVGGIDSIRGFDYGMAGPVDKKYEPIGALNMVNFSAEFLYPLSKSLGLRGAAFYDIGKGWGYDPGQNIFDTPSKNILPLRQAVGVGIRWYSPFGPIRVDWGYNITPLPHRGEKSNVWSFSMGAMF